MIFTISPLFSDYCVLQRDKVINIFGTVDFDCKVQVILLSKNRKKLLAINTTKVTCNNKITTWNVTLPKQKKQNDCTLSYTYILPNKNCLEPPKSVKHIDIGEVWICAGQSNMEFELQNCTEGPEELSQIQKHKNIRYYYTNKISYIDKDFYKKEENTSWQTVSSPNAKAWSAIGYMFAKKLSKDINCSIGLIGCNWGGTSASAWMDKEYLSKDEDLKTYLTDYESQIKNKSIEQQIKEYDAYEKEAEIWNKKYQTLWEQDHNITWEQAEQTLGKNPWPGPASCKNPFRPCGLYQTMFSRICSYTVKGVLWYQGESDDHKPNMYAKLFSSLIQNWRKDLNDSNLPFIFVQLANHRYLMDKDFKNWCIIRDQQQKVFNSIKNTFMVVAMDKGQFNDIHPKSKKDIAIRMENIALTKIYNHKTKKEVLSPMLDSYTKNFLYLTLYFNNAKKGFKVKDCKQVLQDYIEYEMIQNIHLPQNFTGFEVAGEDKVFYPADFSFKRPEHLEDITIPKNTIYLSCKEVKYPCYVRYAYYNYGPTPIYNKDDLPLAPFFTELNKLEN